MLQPEQLAIGSPEFPGQAAPPAEPVGAWLAALGTDPLAALARIGGDFAVALPLGGDRWLLAVDRFAVRTLCWRVDGGVLRWSTRADALATPAGDIDPQALYDYLHFHNIPAPRTVWAGVQRLPAGHALLWERGQARVLPYWTPTFESDRPGRFEEHRAQFMALVEDAVRRQLDGTTPACFLSGGTDSSTVAGMLARVGGAKPLTYSIGFDAQGYDEMSYARLAARHFGTEHREYYVTAADLVQHIPAVAADFDQPFGNSSVLPAHCCALRAREDGVTRLLAGDGGDELFGGNARYAKQRVFGWYRHVPAALRGGLLEPLLERTPLGTLPLLRKGRSYVEQAKLPMPDRLELYNLLPRLGVRDVLTPDFLGQVDPSAPLAQQREVWNAAEARHEIDRTLAFDWRYTLADSDLPKVRMSTALAGVSVGFPLLDARLLAFSMTLPPGYKLKGLKLRWFFKEALRGFLPDEILTKSKHGFGLPFGVWAVQDPALQRLARDSLHALASRGMVRPDFIEKLLQQLLPQHPGYYGEMVWILMMLEQWLRSHAPNWKVTLN
ncbi:MAG: asparagine synthase [Rubrivivax sp.]|nr:asparagine synthase [Rubrivivax sp.]